tara:strand:- start:443 stop:823 length:381 start_codon:yes stop_codon:yes gene_type:complete
METKTHSEIIDEIEKKLPNWILNVVKEYDDQYPHLKKNWKLICKKLNTTPKYILIVNNIPNIKNKDANIEILDYCSKLTQVGYIIRRKEELIVSKKGKAIPSQRMYTYMCNSPNLKEFMPETWSDL